MGVLDVEVSVLEKRRPLLLHVFFPTAIYALLVLFTAWRHEPWADEAQAWLLARDSSLLDLWTRLLHYEGTPGLWHSLLWLLTRLTLPYGALNFVSALLSVTAAYLVFRFAPFTAPVRLPLPFAYFLAYQYAVVARSYCLLPPLIFGIAAVFTKRESRQVLYVTLLSALSLCSLHGLVLSAVIALFTFRRRAVVVYMVIAGLGAWSAYPAPDVMFVRHLNFSAAHLWQQAGRILGQAFAGHWAVSLVLIMLTVPFLSNGRSLWLFVVSAVSLIGLMAVVYGQVWHFGTVFLAWIFACWLAALRVRPGWLASIAILTVLTIHVTWTVRSAYREASTAYSAGLNVSRFVAAEHLPEAGLYGVGYACVAVQPYFTTNAFLNFTHSYWDWSSRNHMIRDYDTLPDAHPAWVLVGYKTKEEDYIWNTQVRRSGYRLVRHFEGNLIWKGDSFEPESFDLYRRK